MLPWEFGVNAYAWKLVIHELTVNKRFAPREWNTDKKLISVKKGGERYNRTGPIIAHLAIPDTHRTRCAIGLTVDVDDVNAIGAVLRVKPGEYRWFPDAEIIDVSCIRTGSVDNVEAITNMNHKWVFVESVDDVVRSKPSTKVESRTDGEATPETASKVQQTVQQKVVVASTVPTTVPKTNGYQMVGTLDPDMIVVSDGTEFKVLKVVASFTVDE